jgi:hypothetical protein
MDQKAPVYTTHITIDPIEESKGPAKAFRWMVSFKAPDHRGERLLGYRACGIVNSNSTGFKFQEEPQVHDAERPVWTTMPSDQRPDIRREIAAKAKKALEMMRKSGKPNFEYVIN